MATVVHHTELSVVDKNGNVDIIYPINMGRDVSIDTDNNESIPAGIRNVQNIVDAIGEMAFDNGDNILRVGEADGDYDFNNEIMTEINDTKESLASTWSSKKITESFVKFKSSKDIKLNDIIDIPTVPTVFTVDGQNNTFGALCPEQGYIWTVEYFPVTVVAKNSIAGSSEGTYETKHARQKWTGYQFDANNETPKIYSRIYCNNSWGVYTREN